ncbi:hypothetical protein VM1G_11652 [Cytospora mali]|uniref:Uncharacterized protein n=1 Tax=Cytospora mali TaxID=578113 RepID=A0A194W3Z6_CYTMA|nr:hypothetical protein VM1G_11652 [Valsa mali]
MLDEAKGLCERVDSDHWELSMSGQGFDISTLITLTADLARCWHIAGSPVMPSMPRDKPLQR